MFNQLQIEHRRILNEEDSLTRALKYAYNNGLAFPDRDDPILKKTKYASIFLTGTITQVKLAELPDDIQWKTRHYNQQMVFFAIIANCGYAEVQNVTGFSYKILPKVPYLLKILWKLDSKSALFKSINCEPVKLLAISSDAKKEEKKKLENQILINLLKEDRKKVVVKTWNPNSIKSFPTKSQKAIFRAAWCFKFVVEDVYPVTSKFKEMQNVITKSDRGFVAFHLRTKCFPTVARAFDELKFNCGFEIDFVTSRSIDKTPISITNPPRDPVTRVGATFSIENLKMMGFSAESLETSLKMGTTRFNESKNAQKNYMNSKKEKEKENNKTKKKEQDFFAELKKQAPYSEGANPNDEDLSEMKFEIDEDMDFKDFIKVVETKKEDKLKKESDDIGFVLEKDFDDDVHYGDRGGGFANLGKMEW